MLVTPSGMVIEVSEEQPSKVPPMVFMLLGIVIEVSDLQCRKADHPILFTLLGIVIEVNEEQSAKAKFPTLVTPSGMVIEVKPEQP